MNATEKAIKLDQEECNKVRENLPEGPWTKEPDRIEWIGPNGYRCLMQRNPYLFIWCGYVGVPSNHWAYGKPYDALGHLEAPGGLSYSQHCQSSICHITEGNDDLYWLGFNCGHDSDIIPKFRYASTYYKNISDPCGRKLSKAEKTAFDNIEKLFSNQWSPIYEEVEKKVYGTVTYKDVAFVRKAVEHLAEQLGKQSLI
jgi:hypothetical protein